MGVEDLGIKQDAGIMFQGVVGKANCGPFYRGTM